MSWMRTLVFIEMKRITSHHFVLVVVICLSSWLAIVRTVTTGQDVDLLHLTTTSGFKMLRSVVSERAGSVVSAAGDVNNDGIDDIIVGTSASANKVYVVFGNGSAISPNINFATMVTGPKTGYRITGTGTGYRAGDVNGDGIQDIFMKPSGNFAIVVFGTPQHQAL